jgi:hypothetical protein
MTSLFLDDLAVSSLHDEKVNLCVHLHLSEDYGIVHHLSWVGPEERIQRKLGTPWRFGQGASCAVRSLSLSASAVRETYLPC